VGRNRFILELLDCGGALDGDVYVRMRRLLKHALRTLAFRCTSVEEDKGDAPAVTVEISHRRDHPH
jgi:hypothetical protein